MFTKSTRRKISCQKCNGEACRSCWKSWLLIDSEERCMYPSCGAPISRQYLVENFPKAFITGDLKRHREDVYYERERGLLPATQPVVDEIIRREKIGVIARRFSQDVSNARNTYNEKWRDLVRELSDDENDGILILTISGERVNTPELIAKYWDSEKLGNYGSESPNKPPFESWVHVYTSSRLVRGIRGAKLIKLLPLARALRDRGPVSDFYYLAMLVISRGGNLSNNTTMEWRRHYNDRLEPIRQSYRLEMAQANERYNTSREEAGLTEDIQTNSESSKFTLKCMKEDCRGYLNGGWTCGLCESRWCKECHQLLTDDHICKEDDIATAKILKSDTKPCPGCGVSIHKIDGCNQMWCTQCRTAWDWRTGNIQKKVHNPHYFEYLRSLDGEQPVPRNPNDVICGRELDTHFIQSLSFIMRRHSTPTSVTDTVVSVISGMNEMDDYIDRDIGDSPRTESLRVAFIMGHVEESTFKRQVQARYKKWHKDRDILDLMVMFRQTVIDILYRYRSAIDYASTPMEALGHAKILDEIQVLQDYANRQLQTIANTYQSKPKAINVYQRESTDGTHRRVGIYTL